jgi:hypothetical protein
MRRLVAILAAAVFSAVTFSVYAADQSTQGTQPQKPAKKKKHKSTGVSQSANPMDKSGQGTAQSSGTGAVKAGGESVNQPGRADPKATQGAGGISSPTPTGAGRANNQ